MTQIWFGYSRCRIRTAQFALVYKKTFTYRQNFDLMFEAFRNSVAILGLLPKDKCKTVWIILGAWIVSHSELVSKPRQSGAILAIAHWDEIHWFNHTWFLSVLSTKSALSHTLCRISSETGSGSAFRRFWLMCPTKYWKKPAKRFHFISYLGSSRLYSNCDLICRV